MSNRKIFMFVLFVLCPIMAQSQEKKTNNIRIGLEAGADAFFGKTIVPDQIRESKSGYPYSDDFLCGFPGPESSMPALYIGAKSEFFFMRNQVGLSAGLRFSQYSSALEPNKDYFLWLLHQEGLHTDYVKIDRMGQKNYYLGIPLELRFFPQRRERIVQHYFKLGAAVNFHLGTKQDITFPNAEMMRHSETIISQINAPEKVHAYIYPAFGLKIGRANALWFNIEFHFPGMIVSNKAIPFIQTDLGMGLQFSVQVPLGTTVPIGSK